MSRSASAVPTQDVRRCARLTGSTSSSTSTRAAKRQAEGSITVATPSPGMANAKNEDEAFDLIASAAPQPGCCCDDDQVLVQNLACSARARLLRLPRASLMRLHWLPAR